MVDVDAVKRSPFVFPLACAAAAAMVFISEGSYWQAISQLSELSSMRASRERLHGIERSILDAETGQRGYLLTARKDYLLPYAEARADIALALQTLDKDYREARYSTESRALLRQLQDAAGDKLSELALTLRLYDEGRVAAGLEILRSDIGREQMESVRALADRLLALEADKLAASRGDLYRILLLGRSGMALVCALALLALYLYLRQVRLQQQHQHALKRAVQAERDRLDTEVCLRTAQLTELTQHLQTAREDERSRLARNLHDELGALLTAAKLDAARIKSRLGAGAPEALERLAHLVETLNSSIALGRRIIEDLRPSTLGNLGLVPTLEILAREFGEGSDVAVHCALAPVALAPTTELVVYRLVQEAITNISKYAQAREVWISLATVGQQVAVSVRDDGVGFDSRKPAGSTFGLLGMRFRVEAEGGTLAVASAPGAGTTVQVLLPQARPAG